MTPPPCALCATSDFEAVHAEWRGVRLSGRAFVVSVPTQRCRGCGAEYTRMRDIDDAEAEAFEEQQQP